MKSNLFSSRCAALAALLLVSQVLEGAEVQPPVKIYVSRETNSTDEAKLLPSVSQSAVLRQNHLDLHEGSVRERIEKLKRKALADLIHLPSGTFLMGDFGTLVTEEKLPLTFSRDNKPFHKVTLSSFSISRYKTTFAEYDVFLDAMNLAHLDDKIEPYRNSTVPAGAMWQQAKYYCR
ncbi:SUMF1/EgtB/PvdO family nonheme iron enzyme [Paraburkholderia bannensis]|uniref:SUMF1/EgtB/PvdO family nonheme iron enzyme n=1 Tax=Paraburkholderia bannensis TaxID=765414 RepID=UPI0038BCAE32